MSDPRPRPGALRHRDFRLFWLGLVVSGFGSQFSTVAMAWQIYELTDSPLQLGLLGLARGLPQVVLLLFGGLLADAMDRRRLVLLMLIAQCAVSSWLGALSFSGSISPTALYAASLLMALFSSLEGPARQAMVPNLVPRSDLTNALALNSTQRQASNIAGPAIAGVVLGVWGAPICYLVDASSWLGMLGALAAMRTISQEATGMRGMSLFALKEGVWFVWTHPVLLAMMWLDFSMNLFGNVRGLLPIYARDILLVGPEGLGLLYAATAVGALPMAAVLSVAGQVRRAGAAVLAVVILYALTTIGFSVSHLFWVSFGCLALAGAANAMGAVLRQTINQLATPDDLRGRVGGVNSIFTMSSPQLGQFRAGATAEAFGPEMSALSGGVLTLLSVALIVGLVPGVRRHEIQSQHTVRTAP